ncbi:OmpA family protein [Thalassococcus sp. S3]|uniref:OmpA family protein n=1 Tax=Thalassococcus sp. S3 TaxID=2017482 RepID=UPI0010246A7A|nr:OmpA family protein [Thalassococcus sp. S3]QBF33117.1 hypothetical protein CFI11_18080 [Thalassococcus sp. S3]
MTRTKTPLLVAASAVLALGACTDPAFLDPNNPNQNRDQGVLLGAGVGAALGNIVGGDTEATIAGAVVGGTAGGLIGNRLDRQEADLRRQIGNDRVTITNTGDRLIVTMPQDILFATGSADVRPDLAVDLRAVASNLQSYPDSVIQVLGHTDNVGDAGFNQGLSERRANSVSSVLIGAGVSPNRIQTLGRGEDQPIASNLTNEGRAQNRRVEIVILPTAA